MTAMFEQGRLIHEAAGSIVAVAPQGWQQLLYRVFATNEHRRSELQAWTVQGHTLLREDPATATILNDLRQQMYQPGRGTWYTAELEIHAANGGSAQTRFDYDTEPDLGLSAADYARDLAAFPRDEEHRPGWLRERLAQAEAGSQAESPEADLEAYGRALFGRLPGGGGELSAQRLPRGLGVCVFQSFRGGGKLYIAPDRSAMFSPSSESFEQGLAAFEAGERSREDQLPKP